MEEAKLVAASAIALAVTLFAIFSLRPLARRLGLVDKPGGRKAHRGHVPLIGGLCFFFGTVVGLAYLGYVDGFVASLLVPCALIVMTGAVDDLNNLSVKSRLVIQASTAWLVCWFSTTTPSGACSASRRSTSAVLAAFGIRNTSSSPRR